MKAVVRAAAHKNFIDPKGFSLNDKGEPPREQAGARFFHRRPFRPLTV